MWFGGYDSDGDCSWDDTEVTFLRPDGDEETKDVQWCLDNDFFQIEEGIWSGNWYYDDHPEERRHHSKRLKETRAIRRRAEARCVRVHARRERETPLQAAVDAAMTCRLIQDLAMMQNMPIQETANMLAEQTGRPAEEFLGSYPDSLRRLHQMEEALFADFFAVPSSASRSSGLNDFDDNHHESADGEIRPGHDVAEVSFLSSEGCTEERDIQWCLDHDDFQVEKGVCSDNGHYQSHPKERAVHQERIEHAEQTRRQLQEQTKDPSWAFLIPSQTIQSKKKNKEKMEKKKGRAPFS